MRNIIFFIIENMRVICTPSCWFQNERYSRYWDDIINKAIDNGKFEEITEYSANIGGLKLWISNHPYASFTPYEGIKVRPSRKTILKAYDRLLIDIFGAA